MTSWWVQGDTAHVRSKKQMLEAEGVEFQGSHLASADFVVPATSLPSV